MSRLVGDMKGFVVSGVFRLTVKKQNKEKHCYEESFRIYYSFSELGFMQKSGSFYYNFDAYFSDSNKC